MDGDFNFNANYHYSPLTSDAQRLPNGNTLICEGCSATIREVTPEKEIVWEYLYPEVGMALLYRAYRIPYEWIPQLPAQEEVPVERVVPAEFKMPGAASSDFEKFARVVEGAKVPEGTMAHCVESLD